MDDLPSEIKKEIIDIWKGILYRLNRIQTYEQRLVYIDVIGEKTLKDCKILNCYDQDLFLLLNIQCQIGYNSSVIVETCQNLYKDDIIKQTNKCKSYCFLLKLFYSNA